MNCQFIIENLKAKVLLRLLLLVVFFPNKIVSQVVKTDSISIVKEWKDCNGKNTLNVTVNALCNPEEPPFDGHKTIIQAHLRNKKNTLEVKFDDPNYQMEMISFNEKNIWFYNLKKANAVFIPFTYCSNSDSQQKLSYIILHDKKKYLYHFNFECTEDGDCDLKESLTKETSDLNPKLRTALMNNIQSKYKKAIDFN